jgi:hypothetical protein
MSSSVIIDLPSLSTPINSDNFDIKQILPGNCFILIRNQGLNVESFPLVFNGLVLVRNVEEIVKVDVEVIIRLHLDDFDISQDFLNVEEIFFRTVHLAVFILILARPVLFPICIFREFRQFLYDIF